MTSRIRLGNCIEIMKMMPNASVDAIVTDFPYGNDTDYGTTYEDTQENLKSLIGEAMPEILRISKRALIFCGVGNMYLYPPPNWTLCWFIPGGVGSSIWGHTSWQPILAYGKDPYLSTGIGGRRPDATRVDAVEMTVKSRTPGHPCPKPLRIMNWLINRGTLVNETVLDPFMGSGTTGVACVRLGRDFIGIEINPDYAETAKKRIKAEELQLTMYSAPKTSQPSMEEV